MEKEDVIVSKKRGATKAPLLISLSLPVLLVAFYFIFPSFQAGVNEAFIVLTSDNAELISAWVAQFKIVGPIVLIVAMVVQMFMFVVPNILLMMIAIISYGPIWGSLISLIGIFSSSTLGYIIGRYLGPYTVSRFISVKTLAKISDFINDYGVGAIAITRLASISNDSLSFVAGILKMSYKKYILATLSGITPLIVLLALYGKNGKIEKALIWIAAISLILLVVYIFFDKRRKKLKLQKMNKKSL